MENLPPPIDSSNEQQQLLVLLTTLQRLDSSQVLLIIQFVRGKEQLPDNLDVSTFLALWYTLIQVASLQQIQELLGLQNMRQNETEYRQHLAPILGALGI